MEKSAVKVGAVVLLALALGIGLWAYLSHFTTNSYKVTVNFTDAQGMVSQGAVRLQGIPVGEITRVDLGPDGVTPIVELSIRRRYKIPTNAHFAIVSGLLIAAPQIQVRVPKGPIPGYLPMDGTAVVQGDLPTSALTSISPELAQTVQSLNQTFTDVKSALNATSKKIDGILDQTQVLMNNANKMASSASSFLSDPSLKRNLLDTLSNVKDTSANAKLMTAQMRLDLDDLVGSSKGNFKELGTKLNGLLDHVDATIQDTDAVVQKLTEQVSDPHLQQSLQETTELARATLSRFNQIASDLHELTGDPALQGDLKQAVANMRDATGTAKLALEKVDQILDKVTGPGGPKLPKAPKIDLTANISEQVAPTRLRVDVDAKMALGPHSLIDLGLYDLGQNTRLNAQFGNRFNDDLTVRYGLYASRIGAGLDFTASPQIGFRADLWDTNRPHLDVKGLYRVNKNASLWIGGDNLLRGPIPLIGVQINK